jgi:putative ABC transport system permease protein
MRMFIHGIKSLIRRPAKTAMLLIILFIVFNLIFIGFIIQNSVQQSKLYIRSQIGGAVEYKMDFTAYMAALEKSRSTAGTTAAPTTATRPPSLSLKVAETIAKSSYVKSFYITESANVNSAKVTPAQTQTTGGGFQRTFSNFTLSGSNQTDNINFVTGLVKLTEGKTFTADNLKNGDKVVIISKDVADANNLRVGDMVSLSYVASQAQDLPGAGGRNAAGTTTAATTTAKAVDYEVIGIYTATSTTSTASTFDVNTMFTSNTVIYDLKGATGADETSGSVVYMLDNPEHVAAFIKEQSPNLTSEYHSLYSNDDEYDSLTKPLNLISFITAILIWVVFIAGAAIILAVATIFVRDRKFEIGLLLSSGEGKLKIIAQFIFEMMLIAIVAFGISVASSNVASKSVSTWIVNNQLLSQTSLIGSTSTTTTTTGIQNFRGPGQTSTSVSVYGSVDMQKVANQFDVAVSFPVVMNLLMASALLVLIGSCIPLTAIMGFNPKRILQDY